MAEVPKITVNQTQAFLIDRALRYLADTKVETLSFHQIKELNGVLVQLQDNYEPLKKVEEARERLYEKHKI